MTNARAIARNVRAQIQQAGRKQNEVARRIGMSEASWYRRMDGRVSWRIEELTAIADELGVDLTALTRGAKP